MKKEWVPPANYMMNSRKAKNKMKIKIEFEVEIEDIGATDQEVEDYLRFSFGDNGSLSGKNPYINEGEPEPIFGTFEIEIQ